MLSKITQFLMVIGALASATHGSALRKLAADFDWDITGNEDWAVTFDESGEAITGTYTLPSGKANAGQFDGTLYLDDCSTAVNSTAVGLAYTQSFAGDVATANLDLDPAVLNPETNDIVSQGEGEDSTKIIIKFCLKVDLYYVEDEVKTSLNFHETKFEIQVDMAKGFTISDIQTTRDEASVSNTNTTVSYGINAVLLDAEAVSVSDNTTWSERADDAGAFSNGKLLSAVVYLNDTSTSSDVTIADITKFSLDSVDMASATYLGGSLFEQGSGTFTKDNVAYQGRVAKTILMADFFNVTGPTTRTLEGTVVLSFGSARRLATRKLQDETSSQFNLNIDLEGQGFDAEVEEESGATVVVSTTMGVLIGCALFFM